MTKVLTTDAGWVYYIAISDNGSQSTSVKFMKGYTVLRINQIFTSYNNPRRNVNTERYFSTYKEEVVWLLDNPNYDELIKRTKKFKRFHNEEYPHSVQRYKGTKEIFKESMRLYKSARFFV